MRARSWVAMVTCLAFTAMVAWPRGASAQAATAEAAQAPQQQADDAAMAEAKQHFEAGRNAYHAGDYAGSIREFKQAEQLRPSPILDYNIGLSNEKLGKRRVAVKYYKLYLEQQPNASNKDEVQQRISSLEAAIAAQPGGAPGQPAAEEQPGDMPPPDATAQQGQPAQPAYDPYASPAPGGPVAVKPHKRSLWWIWLIVAGGALLTVGLIVYVALVAESNTSTTTTTFNGVRDIRGLSAQDRDAKPEFHGVTVLHF